MALFDLFKPQWKHSDPAQRAAAMRGLEEDRQDLFLEAVLSDPDASVRAAAARRLAGEDKLRAALARNTDRGVVEILKKSLVKRLSDQARAAGPELTEAQALAWVDELRGLPGGDRLLEELACDSPSRTLRKHAQAGLAHSGSVLAAALKETDSQLALEAVGRLSRDAHLEAVARGAANREARQSAKERLRTREDARKPDEAALGRAKLHILVSTMEKAEAASSEAVPGFAWESAREQVQDADAAFAQLVESGLQVADDLRERFHGLRDAFLKNYERHAAAEAERQAREAKESAARAEQEEACLRLEALYAEPGTLDENELEAVTRRFRDADADAESENPLRERFRIARDRLVKEKLRKQREQQDAERRREAEAEALRRHGEAEALRAAAAENAVAMEGWIEELEALAESSDLKRTEKRLKEIHGRGKAVAAALESSHAGMVLRYRAAVDRLRETLDWSRWANLQRKQDLCARLEALQQEAASATDLRPVFTRFKDLGAEWKAVGPVPWDATEALWDRYHQASDALYEKCREYFAELDVEREANFKAKEELCARLEALMAAPEVDMREATEAFKEAHSSWKTLGAVPQEKNEALWERFRAVNKIFNDRREGNYKENLRAKQELAALAESLKDSQDWKATAARLKEAQEKWKTIGPVPREKSEALWSRFHDASEAFFQARAAFFGQRDQERPVNLAKKTALCELVESLDELPGDKERYERILDAQAQWKEIGPAPREVEDSLWERFRKPIDAYFEERRGRMEIERGQREEGARVKQELCLEAETLAGSNDWKAGVEKAKALQARWKEAPPAPRAVDQELWKRFRGACDAFFERLKEHSAQRDGERLANLKRKQDLCFEIEIHSGLPITDDAAKAAREAWIAGRQAAGAEVPAAPGDWKRATDRVKQLQQEWRTIGPAPREQNDAVWERFQRASDAFFEERRRALGLPDEDPQANLESKLALIADAEALAKDPGAHQQGAVSALRGQWKRIGPVPRAQSDFVWERFNAACDAAAPREARESREGREPRGGGDSRGPRRNDDAQWNDSRPRPTGSLFGKL